MTPPDWQMLLPWGILAGAAGVSTPLAAFFRSRALAAALASGALIATVIACIVITPYAPQSVTR